MKRSNSNPTSSLSKRKSFRGWLKRVSMPNGVVNRKVEPAMPKGGVFGIPLSMSIKYAKTTVGYVDDDGVKHTKAGAIPIVVAKCGSFLKKNGQETEGIFRISGNMKRINELEFQFDQSSSNYGLDLNWDGYTVHDAASLLRRYLNKLPDPVIPFEFYNQFRDVMNDKTFYGTGQRIEEFQRLIQSLPAPHQHLLLYLLDTLSLFASVSADTKMDISNLAAVFCPGLLRHPDHNTPVQYKISQYVIEFLVEYQSLFTMQLLMGQKKSSSGNSSTGEVPPVPLLLPSSYPQKKPTPIALRVVNPSTSSELSTTSSVDTQSFAESPQDIIESTKDRDIVSQEPFANKLANATRPHLKRVGENLTAFGHQIRPWIAKPTTFLICASALVTTFFVIVYEAYLVLTLSSFEPFVFFIGLASYWGLLYNGLSKEELGSTPSTPKATEPALPIQPAVPDHDPVEEEEEEEFETSMDEDAERAMLEDESIMSEWSDLLTRKWKTSSEESDIKTESSIADTSSIMSRSSRFDEEEEEDYNQHTSSDDDEEDLGFDPETLESYLAQYDQIKKDAQLAKELQMAEQKARDVNNPFMVDTIGKGQSSDSSGDNIASPSDSKEEWKVRIFPRS